MKCSEFERENLLSHSQSFMTPTQCNLPLTVTSGSISSVTGSNLLFCEGPKIAEKLPPKLFLCFFADGVEVPLNISENENPSSKANSSSNFLLLTSECTIAEPAPGLCLPFSAAALAVSCLSRRDHTSCMTSQQRSTLPIHILDAIDCQRFSTHWRSSCS